MIRSSFILKNWRPKESDHSGEGYYYKFGSFSRYKHWEIQIDKFDVVHNLLELTLDLCWTGSDHAGPEVVIDLFGFWLSVKMYDSRHWDYKLGKWEEHPGAIQKREEAEDDGWGDE